MSIRYIRMNRIIGLAAMVMTVLLVMSCRDGETYGDKKNKERAAISQFLADSAINVITEAQFETQSNTTDVSKNEYVFLNKSGIYMQIVEKGCGKPIAAGETVNVICRFSEYNILDRYMQLQNTGNVHVYDKMTVTRSSGTYTGSFSSGQMYSAYGASVPAAWLVPFNYINIGREMSDTDRIAFVKLIVPHSQGQIYAQQSVYPCFYCITYQKQK